MLTDPTIITDNVWLFAGALVTTSVITGIVLALIFLVVWRKTHRRSAREKSQQEMLKTMALERARESESRLGELLKNQNELTSRMQTMGEIFGSRQTDMMKLMDERLANMSGRMGQTMGESTKLTSENLSKIQERLAVIDHAQNNITALAGQMVELQKILGNKQTRGIFGEAQMQVIIQDALPKGSYKFHGTLSNHKIPDCLIHMPNDMPPLVVDAKFPLEAWNAIRASKTPETEKRAQQLFRRDVEEHIRAISEKYLIAGETQDRAFMFVPSESVFAEIHENYENIVQKAHRVRVVIVSPSLLMLSVQMMQSILKDQRMREHSHLIQDQLVGLMQDIDRLDVRVRKLAGHFGQAQKDVEMIVTSAGKIAKRGNQIADLDFKEPSLDGTQQLALDPEFKTSA